MRDKIILASKSNVRKKILNTFGNNEFIISEKNGYKIKSI